MRAVVQHGPKDLRVEERAVPEPGPGEVLVRVRANGICGSDLHFWKHAVYGTGVILGHEISGEVAAVGPGVQGLRTGELGPVHAGIPCGDCGRCRAGLSHFCQNGSSLGSGGDFGGLAEYLLAPAENFLAAPDGFDAAALTFTEPLANGLRCLDFPEVRQARSAVVIGSGPIGLSCLIAARESGVERIWMLEGRARRRDAALELGAERVLHPTDDDVKGALLGAFPHGADLVVEAVGLPETLQSSFRWVRPGGTVVLMGVLLGSVELQPIAWMLKELTIRSSIGCARQDQLDALRLVADGRVDAKRLVTRRIGLEEVPDAVAALADGADEIKVVVEHGRD
jgi:2-desacetyl-2-hydroxyethyl bacteriochlorophyllide A dehydrogenase